MRSVVSTLEKEGPYQAAKWLKVPVLADAEEIASLFKRLGLAEIYLLGTPAEKNSLHITQETFLASIQRWTDMLQSGSAPTMADCKATLASALTSDPECLWMQELSDGRVLMKIRRPVIQIQAHFFAFSPEEKSFHSMVFGKESVFWGIQFSYPQVFMESEEPKKVDGSFANSALFQEIRQWARDETRATPFLFGEEKINVPIRLGKKCFSWIARHPQLLKFNLGVAGAR